MRSENGLLFPENHAEYTDELLMFFRTKLLCFNRFCVKIKDNQPRARRLPSEGGTP